MWFYRSEGVKKNDSVLSWTMKFPSPLSPFMIMSFSPPDPMSALANSLKNEMSSESTEVMSVSLVAISVLIGMLDGAFGLVVGAFEVEAEVKVLLTLLRLGSLVHWGQRGSYPGGKLRVY